MTDEKSPLELVEARRAARRAAEQKAHDVQAAIDLEAIDALEVQYGDANIAALKLPFIAEGLPVRLAVRTPTRGEFKRFRDTVAPQQKDRKGQTVAGDPFAAAEALGAVCTVYPDRNVLDKICEKRPGVLAQLGGVAAQLANASEEDEGKGS